MKKRGVLSVIIGFLVIAGIAAAVVVSKRESHRFYFPDRNYQRLRAEWRNIRLESYGRTFEEMLVREYLLGPVDYRMRLSIDSDTLVRNVWIVKGDARNKESVIIDFGGNFSNNIIFNNETYDWMIKGLARTLKANTQVKSIIILGYGNQLDTFLGDYNIGYPIVVE